MNIDDTVWVLSAPRTGSTNLADALLADERDFVSPRLIEVIFPFICINRAFDALDCVLQRFGTSFERVISDTMASLNSVTPDALDHHSSGLFNTTQFEILVSYWLNVSPPTQFSFPDSEYWRQVFLLDRLEDATYNRVHALRNICLKKVLYRRGNGRRLVFKAHCTEDANNLYHFYPKAVFVLGCRRPAEQVTPMLENAKSFQMSLTGTSAYTPNWVQARLEWLEHVWACELDFCRNFPPEERAHKLLTVPFQKFLNDPEAVMRHMFRMTGIQYDDDPYLKDRVAAFVKEQREFKNQRKNLPSNMSLESLGLNEVEINEKFREYVEFFGLSAQ